LYRNPLRLFFFDPYVSRSFRLSIYHTRFFLMVGLTGILIMNGLNTWILINTIILGFDFVFRLIES